MINNFANMFVFPKIEHESSANVYVLLLHIFLVPLSSDARTAGLVKIREPYPFGVDPSWRGSRTELPFLNSLKMKMSILLGVAQMNLGIILSYFNARFFRSSLDIRCFSFSCVYCPSKIFLLH